MMSTPKCTRCSKKYRNRGAWNVELRAGVPVGLLCPRCQTPEESIEAEVHEATIDYQGVDQFGRLWGRPKIHGIVDAGGDEQ